MVEDGYRLLLPKGVLDYFEVLKVEEEPRFIKIHLEEKNNITSVGETRFIKAKGSIPLF